MGRLAGIVALLLSFVGFAAADPPNILFIYTDDQAAWALGSVNPDFHTPNLDRLFARGAVLSNAFVTTPVCSPSRAGLLASRYGTEVGITDWISPTGGEHRRDESQLGLDPGLPTWVRQLRDAGYATALVGKWHLGTQDRFHPSHFGYERFIGFRAGGNKVESPELEVDGEARVVPGLTTDVLTDFAIDVIRSAGGDEPFLLSLHYRAPHSPWKPVAEADAAPYEGKTLAPGEPDVPDLDIERVQRILGEYAASVTGVDRNIGRLLEVLDEQGLTDDTIIVFTSDHGYNIGHHGIFHKGNGHRITKSVRGLPTHDPRVARPNLFDTSLRVPAAVVWPGKIAAGSTVDAVVTNLDWYPTLLALAGLAPPADAPIHGRDFSPLLRGEQVGWDNSFYGEYAQHHYIEADLRMWRTPEWKLVRDFLRPGHDELYHLAEDPGETRNLVADADYTEKVAELDAHLREAMHFLQNAKFTASLMEGFEM